MAKTLDIATEGVHSVSTSGVVTFTPKSTFKDDPTDIEYTVKSADGTITSNRARISIKYQKITGAHVFLIAGSTNAVGYTQNVLSQTYPENIYQIARETSITGNRDKSLASIEERALDNNSMVTPKDTPSFAIEFINRYAADNAGVPIVLVPCAELLTSFASGSLGVGGANFNDALGRTNDALLANPTWSLKGILYHYGEDDARANNLDHKTQFQNAMAEFRNSLLGAENIPIVFGELADAWVQAAGKSSYQTNIQWNTIRATNSYCASSTSPTVLAASNEAFSDEALQELGRRMYAGYRQIERKETDASAHWIFGKDNTPYASVDGLLRITDASRVSLTDSGLFQDASKPIGRTETGFTSGIRSFSMVISINSEISVTEIPIQVFNSTAGTEGYIEIYCAKTSNPQNGSIGIRILNSSGTLHSAYQFGNFEYGVSLFFGLSIDDTQTVNAITFSTANGAIKNTKTIGQILQLSRGVGIGKGGRRISEKIVLHEIALYSGSITPDAWDVKLESAKQRFRDRFVNSKYNDLGA